MSAFDIIDLLSITLSIISALICVILMIIFYHYRKSPAFIVRKVTLTLNVSCLMLLTLFTPTIAELTDIILFDTLTQIILLYCLFLTIVRSWTKIYIYKIGHLDLDETDSNSFWLKYRPYLASNTFIQMYYFILFLIISVPSILLSILFSNNNNKYSFIYIHCLYGLFMICSLLIIKLLIYNVKMKDQFNLSKEIKIYYSICIISLILMVIIEYNSTKLDHVLLTIICSILSISFIAFPIYQYHKTVSGVLVTKQAKHLEEFMKSSKIKNENDYPTLTQFLTKNKKCFDAFKSHLAKSWAVENILFFSDVQSLRYSHLNSETNLNHKTEINPILKIEFKYLKNANKSISNIKTEWFTIYNRYISSNAIYQINVESDIYESIELFKSNINENKIKSIDEYFESLNEALLQIWQLMEGLYVYFRLRPDYKRIIRHCYLEQMDSQKEMEIVVERMEQLFDD